MYLQLNYETRYDNQGKRLKEAEMGTILMIVIMAICAGVGFLVGVAYGQEWRDKG